MDEPMDTDSDTDLRTCPYCSDPLDENVPEKPVITLKQKRATDRCKIEVFRTFKTQSSILPEPMFAINPEVLRPSWAKISHMGSIAAHQGPICVRYGPQLLRLRKVLELRDFLET